MTPIDIIGFLASFCVMLSVTFTSQIKLRVVNTLGCLLFLTYGMLIHSNSIIVTNLFIIAINLIYIIKHYGKNT